MRSTGAGLSRSSGALRRALTVADGSSRLSGESKYPRPGLGSSRLVPVDVPGEPVVKRVARVVSDERTGLVHVQGSAPRHEVVLLLVANGEVVERRGKDADQVVDRS